MPSGRNNKNLQVTVTELNRGHDFTDQSSSAAYSSITENAIPIMPSTRNYFGTGYFRDSSKLNFGNDQDLEIYHDGSNSYISDSGTGSLTIEASTLLIENAAGNQNMIQAHQGAAVNLYHANTKRFETTSTGAKITGQLNFDDGSSTANTN